MPDNGIDQIGAEIQRRGAEWYPERGEVSAVRIVGRTPRNDHYIYELVVEFAQGPERVSVKLYRQGKTGTATASQVAAAENRNLHSIWRMSRGRELGGVPRPLGDFSERGAVVSEKLAGTLLQSMIMKAALLPGYAEVGLLQSASSASGAWLRSLQRITARKPRPLDRERLQLEVERLCDSCRGEGLDDASIGKIVLGTRSVLKRARNPVTNSAVLHEFTPLNVVVLEEGVGVGEFARLEEDGCVYTDAALFLASVEALEKYPFCNHAITTEVQERFLEAYGAGEQDRALLGVFKMKVLLSMFAAGRTSRESPARKKAMWANVMKKFIQVAADRSMPRAA